MKKGHVALGLTVCAFAVCACGGHATSSDPEEDESNPESTSGEPGTNLGDDSPPSDDQPAGPVRAPDPEPRPTRELSIRGHVLDHGSREPLGGVEVCATVDYVTECGWTDESGRFELPGIIGFDAAELLFWADGYPVNRFRVPLDEGSAWLRATLVSSEAFERFTAGFGSSTAIGEDAIIVRVLQSLASSARTEPLSATHVSVDFESQSLDVTYADPTGRADPELDAMTEAGLAVVVDPPAGWVDLSFEPGGACRFRQGFDRPFPLRETVLVSRQTITRVDAVCHDAFLND